MKMMKKLLTSLLLLIAFFTQAQKINYTYYFNDPTKLSNKKVYLDILSLDGIKLGAGVHGYYQPIKLITINGLFRYIYLDLITKQAEKASTNAIKASFTGEVGVQFQFAGYVKKKERKVGVLLEGGMTSKTYVKVPAKKGKSFALRGGLMMYRQPVKNTNAFPFVSDGKELDSTKAFFSNATSTCMYFGLTGRKVRKVGIDATGYGKRRNYLSRVFFADVIMGGTVLSNVEFAGVTYKIKDSEKDPLGFRIGWEWDQLGTVTRFEIGKRPGFVGNIFPINYVMLSFGFSIYGKEKFSFPDKENEPKK